MSFVARTPVSLLGIPRCGLLHSRSPHLPIAVRGLAAAPLQEMTGDDVTECTGGVVDIKDHNLSDNYQSVCDPRLNYAQSLEIAFMVAKRLSTRSMA